MAVYRADQAQVTFMTEPAAGGYVELAASTNSAGTASAELVSNTNAGTRTIAVNCDAANTKFSIGEYLQIGLGTSTIENEIRRIEHVTAVGVSPFPQSITLHAPTAFYHAAEVVVKQVTVIQNLGSNPDPYITLIPGVYETVDVPDPEQTIEGKWFLGTESKRSFFAAYSGQQTYAGSIGGFALLNGKALRYPIGTVSSRPGVGGTVGTSYMNAAATMFRTLNVAAKKGDLFVTVNDEATALALAVGHRLVFEEDTVRSEVRATKTAVAVGDASAAEVLQLDYPLSFDHAADTKVNYVGNTKSAPTALAAPTDVIPFTHQIREAIELDSVTWHVHMKASDEDAGLVQTGGPADTYNTGWNTKDFDRRYYGGKIGNASIAAEEGNMITASWDSVNFLGMMHNQLLAGGTSQVATEQTDVAETLVVDDTATFTEGMEIKIDSEIERVVSIDSATTMTVEREIEGTAAAHLVNKDVTGNVDIPFTNALMTPIRSDDVTATFPTNEPFYFSSGEVQMFGQTIARIRSFTLTINNNEEPRYYVSKQVGRRRGPTEIKEQRREYTLAATLALPDATQSNVAARTVFNELLLEGNYGSLTDFIRKGRAGFNVVLTLTKGIVADGEEDKITITIPDDGVAKTGGNNQGAFIRTAPHNITEDNPFQVEADILFRNMKIDVQDAEHYYP